jgi:hypothetical protein
MTEKLLEQLTVALLVKKFPTFDYNLPLFVVFNNIQQFDVVVILGLCLCLHDWFDMCVCVCVCVCVSERV